MRKTPHHIAIVMDGNGRWANSRGLLRLEGHRVGAEVVKTVIRCCLEKNIPTLSLFAFSSENWARPDEEVEFLMDLFLQSLKTEVEILHEHGVRLRFIGNRQALSSALQSEMQQAELLMAENSKLSLNVVINYGGRWDIIEATKKIAQEASAGLINIDSITEESFSKYLSTSDLSEPDLFIRTSGEQRISNFFLWQLAYTEFYFSKVHWPDFSKEEFNLAIENFQKRERRYGKTSQQLSEVYYV